MSLLSRLIQSRKGYEPVETACYDYEHDIRHHRTETVASHIKDRSPWLSPYPAVSDVSSSLSSRSSFGISRARLSKLSRLPIGIGKGKGRRRAARSLLVLILVVLLLSPPIAAFLGIGHLIFPNLSKELAHYTTGLQCRMEINKLDGLPLTFGILRNTKYSRYDRDRDYEDDNPNELAYANEDDDDHYDANEHVHRDSATRTNGPKQSESTKKADSLDDQTKAIAKQVEDLDEDDELTWSQVMNATELMDRLLKSELERVPPRILHQSWKNYHLPKRFARWSKSWRKIHGPDWTYVLWTDADNRALVENFYPEYLEIYDSLPREIYRADMARNMYMHRFGGIYADLDLVPLSPIPEHLPPLSPTSPSTPLSNSKLSSLLNSSTAGSKKTSISNLGPIRIAYVGRMSPEDFEHSIPNAFMATTSPGHPFWLQPLEFIREHMTEERYNRQPEELTGPVALKKCVLHWDNEDERKRRYHEGVFDIVEILGEGKIYPFSWWDASFVDQCICRPQSVTFDPRRCNSLYPDAWTITYWSHSWENFEW